MSQGTKLASLSSKEQLRSLKRSFEWFSCEKDEKLEEDNISCSLFTSNVQPEEFPDDKMTSHRELRLTKFVGSTTDGRNLRTFRQPLERFIFMRLVGDTFFSNIWGLHLNLV